ncbi:MAG: phosphate ABC transporter ATP-binding protein [Olsenella sp.]
MDEVVGTQGAADGVAAGGEVPGGEVAGARPADEVVGISHLTVAYDGVEALHDVSLSVRDHRVLAVIGPSGCGKTTLLRSVNRLVLEGPHVRLSGQVTLRGRDVARMPAEELRRNVGMVFQEPSPFPFSIWRNVTYAPRYFGGASKRELEDLVREKLELVGLWDEVSQDLRKSALRLSGGQQQRLCIARAIAVDPQVLLLDEPCSALDVNATATVERALLRLRERYAIVVVTHNIGQARRIADEVAFMSEGRVVERGPAEQVLDHPRMDETRAFLAGWR